MTKYLFPVLIMIMYPTINLYADDYTVAQDTLTDMQIGVNHSYILDMHTDHSVPLTIDAPFDYDRVYVHCATTINQLLVDPYVGSKFFYPLSVVLRWFPVSSNPTILTDFIAPYSKTSFPPSSGTIFCGLSTGIDTIQGSLSRGAKIQIVKIDYTVATQPFVIISAPSNVDLGSLFKGSTTEKILPLSFKYDGYSSKPLVGRGTWTITSDSANPSSLQPSVLVNGAPETSFSTNITQEGTDYNALSLRLTGNDSPGIYNWKMFLKITIE